MKTLFMAILTAAAFVAPHLVRAADPLTVNGIAALVGNSVITREEVERFSMPAILRYRGQFADQPDVLVQRINEALVAALDQLIEQRLILQEFEELKVNIPEAIIEAEVDERVKEDIKRRYDGDRRILAQTLKEQGRTHESYRREIRDFFIEAVMRGRNVPRDVLISPGRIEKHYRENQHLFSLEDRVNLRMIVIDKSRNPVDASRLAREIITKLDDGADFAEMAAVYSDGSDARNGGSAGWIDRKYLREDLSEIAFNLTPGKRSDPIDQPEAIYIMLVEEARPAHLRPLTEVRDEIERALVEAERARLQKEWLERLYKKSYVSRFWVIPTSRRATAPSEP
jgi:peptidyl-prolyl cis-trans isomerase SurA